MKKFLTSILILLCVAGFAQEEKRAAIAGNKAYESENYEDARAKYEEALELNEDHFESSFNLGNTLVRKAQAMATAAQESQNQEEQQKLAEASGALSKQAANRFEMIADDADDKMTRAKAYHNMGNAKLNAGDIEGSIESYKKALRNNPDDNETRYNLAYAQRLKEQQEQQQEQQEQDQDQDQDQDQEQEQDQEQQQDQDGDQDEQDQQQDPQDQQDQNEGDEEQQQPQPNQLSQEDAQEMLNALQQEEDEIQNKVKEQQRPAVRIEIEQDW